MAHHSTETLTWPTHNWLYTANQRPFYYDSFTCDYAILSSGLREIRVQVTHPPPCNWPRRKGRQKRSSLTESIFVRWQSDQSPSFANWLGSEKLNGDLIPQARGDICEGNDQEKYRWTRLRIRDHSRQQHTYLSTANYTHTHTHTHTHTKEEGQFGFKCSCSHACNTVHVWISKNETTEKSVKSATKDALNNKRAFGLYYGATCMCMVYRLITVYHYTCYRISITAACEDNAIQYQEQASNIPRESQFSLIQSFEHATQRQESNAIENIVLGSLNSKSSCDKQQQELVGSWSSNHYTQRDQPNTSKFRNGMQMSLLHLL